MSAPLIKWAGGKRQLSDVLIGLAPERIGTYYEPFFGGGAMFFALKSRGKFSKAVIADVNPVLHNFYHVVQQSPASLLGELERLGYGNNRMDYYEARKKFNSLGCHEAPFLKAALFVYLNRHCYNGLYRVNSRGEFNVPFGSYKTPSMPGRSMIMDAHHDLQGTLILNSDFERTLDSAAPDDFVYLDPPYFPVSPTASFTDYHSGGFGHSDQERLAATFRLLDRKGIKVMLSNSATENILDLYDGYSKMVVGARRSINSKAAGRGKIDEVIITNF